MAGAVRLFADPAVAFRCGWCFFGIAAALGAVLRVASVVPGMSIAYAHLLHAHSHVAMLGWIYNAFFAAVLQSFVAPARRAGYGRLFAVTQVAVAGMLATFPFQGYAAASIAFSTLHLGCAAILGWRIMRTVEVNAAARHALGWAFGFMFLSAAGPLALGPLAAAGFRGTPWYSFAIYFYLHFQANGWAVFLLLALSLTATTAPMESTRRGVQLLAAGCLATLALSALGMNPPGWVRAVAIAGSAFQLVALAQLGRAIRPPTAFGAAARALYRLGLVALAGKFVLQFLAAWPGLLELSALRSTIIGFLHLVFLAGITPILVAWALDSGWLRWNRASRAGVGLLVAGTIVTEVVLFSPAAGALLGSGAGWPRVPESLAAAAVIMVAGIVATAFGLGKQPPPAAG